MFLLPQSTFFHTTLITDFGLDLQNPCNNRPKDFTASETNQRVFKFLHTVNLTNTFKEKMWSTKGKPTPSKDLFLPISVNAARSKVEMSSASDSDSVDDRSMKGLFATKEQGMAILDPERRTLKATSRSPRIRLKGRAKVKTTVGQRTMKSDVLWVFSHCATLVAPIKALL